MPVFIAHRFGEQMNIRAAGIRDMGRILEIYEYAFV